MEQARAPSFRSSKHDEDAHQTDLSSRPASADVNLSVRGNFLTAEQSTSIPAIRPFLAGITISPAGKSIRESGHATAPRATVVSARRQGHLGLAPPNIAFVRWLVNREPAIVAVSRFHARLKHSKPTSSARNWTVLGGFA